MEVNRSEKCEGPGEGGSTECIMHRVHTSFSSCTIGAVKIYIAAVDVLRKKGKKKWKKGMKLRKKGKKKWKKGMKLSLPPKLVENLVWVPVFSFCKISLLWKSEMPVGFQKMK